MSDEDSELTCPICYTTTNSSDRPFNGLRSVSLHVAGKAKGTNDIHRSWVRNLMPGVDLRQATINQLEHQIEFYVEEALDELKEKDALAELNRDEILEILRQASPALPVDPPEGLSDEDLQHYTTAYKLIWKSETRLHGFVATALRESTEGEVWDLFPNSVQSKCLERRHNNGNKSPMESYIDLSDLGKIVNHNKKVYSEALDRLKSLDYKDPSSDFSNQLKKVTDIRNQVMHPLRRLTPNQHDLEILERFAEAVQVFVNED